MEETKVIWKRWYMIVLYCFIGLGVLGVIVPNAETAEIKEVEVIKYIEVEVPVEVELPNSHYDEVEYSNFMLEFHNIMLVAVSYIEIISYDAENGRISIYEAGQRYNDASRMFRTALETLDSIDVPAKYENYHFHYRKSIVFFKEGMDLASKGCYRDDVDLIWEGVDKVILAAIEMETATNILNNL